MTSLLGFSPHRILVHLSRGGAEVQIFAPDVPQMHVIDHTKGEPSESESRYGLGEDLARALFACAAPDYLIKRMSLKAAVIRLFRKNTVTGRMFLTSQ